MDRAASARNWSSSRSSRNHRRRSATAEGTRSRRARAPSATREQPVTAAAGPMGSHSYLSSGGLGRQMGLRDLRRCTSAAEAARASARATTSARDREGRLGRGTNSPAHHLWDQAFVDAENLCGLDLSHPLGRATKARCATGPSPACKFGLWISSWWHECAAREVLRRRRRVS